MSRKRSLNTVLILAATLLVTGCGGPKHQVTDADQKYFDALEAAAGGDRSAAVGLLGEAIAAKPGHYMYLKRAELYLKNDDNAAAQDDIRQAESMGAQPEDCQWLRAQADKPLDQRFQGKSASAPGLDK